MMLFVLYVFLMVAVTEFDIKWCCGSKKNNKSFHEIKWKMAEKQDFKFLKMLNPFIKPRAIQYYPKNLHVIKSTS